MIEVAGLQPACADRKAPRRRCEPVGSEPIDQRTITSRYPGKHSAKVCVTSHQPDRFPAAWKDGKTYLMLTKGHILAVVNGTCHDWSRNRSLDCITLFEVL